MTSISIKQYFAVEGSQFSRKDAETIGPFLSELAESGDMTAEHVVAAARSENSPLRAYFEWDDRKAAHLYRVEQARLMIRSIKVRVVENGKEIEMRAFQVHRTAGRNGSLGKYAPTTIEIDPTNQFADTMNNALAELQSWHRRYSAYSSVWSGFGASYKEVLGQMRQLPVAAKDGDELSSALKALTEWRVTHERVTQSAADVAPKLAALFAAIDRADKLVAKHRLRIFDKEVAGSSEPLPEPVKRRCEKCSKIFETTNVGQTRCTTCSAARAA